MDDKKLVCKADYEAARQRGMGDPKTMYSDKLDSV